MLNSLYYSTLRYYVYFLIVLYGLYYKKDAQCAETNERLIIRFLSFIFCKKKIVTKDAQCSETDFLVHELYFLCYL